MNGWQEVDMSEEMEKRQVEYEKKNADAIKISVVAEKYQPLGSGVKDWGKYEDFYGSRKVVGEYVVELLAGTNRGGAVKLWGSDKVTIELGESVVVDGKQYWYVVEGDFWQHKAAKERYEKIKTNAGITKFLEDCL